MHLPGGLSTVTDCIVPSIASPFEGHEIEHCDAFGETAYVNKAAPGKGCITAQPQFVEPRTFDYRLQDGSPCRKAPQSRKTKKGRSG